jgi:integrase
VGYSLQATHQLTELRLTEPVALHPGRADLDAQRISLNGKGGKRRFVPIPRCAAVSPQTLRRGATRAPPLSVRVRQPRVRPWPPVPWTPRVSVGPRAGPR